MKGWIKFVALVLGFALTIYLTSYISKLPESNCTTSPAVDLWSADHAYKATLLKKDCNLSETIFYSVRIDKPEAWFLKIEIEQDPYPAQATEPAMKWDLHKLEIDVPAEKISGSIERREGDLTIVRSYILAKP
jgi:hypothetical protein